MVTLRNGTNGGDRYLRQLEAPSGTSTSLFDIRPTVQNAMQTVIGCRPQRSRGRLGRRASECESRQCVRRSSLRYPELASSNQSSRMHEAHHRCFPYQANFTGGLLSAFPSVEPGKPNALRAL